LGNAAEIAPMSLAGLFGQPSIDQGAKILVFPRRLTKSPML
jgi:hypothetical protein